MLSKISLAIFVILIFTASFFGQWLLTRNKHKNYDDINRQRIRRIVSLSPSVTEILFDLGLGDKVIGVTDYCKYPPEAAKIEKIGGYLDANYEAIVSLHPDLVIMRREFQQAKQRLEDFGIRTIIVNHDEIDGILDSYLTIGKTCAVEETASGKVAQIKERMRIISTKAENLPQKKVLICIERDYGKGSINGAIAVGKDGFYDEILRLAGGKCLFEETGLPFPPVSAESILRANPDVIIDMIPGLQDRGLDPGKIIADWQALPIVSAVKNDKVFLLTQDYLVIPGPRFVMIIEDMAELIHPEIQW